MGHDTIERWLPVVGYEGLYEVSDHGRVRSLDRLVVTKAGYTRRHKGKVMHPQRGRDGYMIVRISRDGTTHNVRVHRLVLEAFVGPCPDNLVACHDNGDPADNRPNNLRWDTQASNMRDKVKHGRHHESRKTHCPRGHLLQGPNLVASQLKRGQRECLACERARGRVRCRPELRPELQQIADNYYRALVSVDG